jgi:hypothetical protein
MPIEEKTEGESEEQFVKAQVDIGVPARMYAWRRSTLPLMMLRFVFKNRKYLCIEHSCMYTAHLTEI